MKKSHVIGGGSYHVQLGRPSIHRHKAVVLAPICEDLLEGEENLYMCHQFNFFHLSAT